MKKYFFIVLIMTLSFNAFAQKKLLIYNFSSYDVNVNTILTKHTTNAYPNISSPNSVVVPAGDYLELYTGYASRFPFNGLDSSSALIIPTWVVQTSATISSTFPANAAALTYGPNQVFHCIKYDDSLDSGILGTGPLGTDTVVLTNTTGYYDEFLTGGIIEYTLVIIDN
jgi:hypothetical protein